MTKAIARFVQRNGIALLALFLALGGTTYAASTALIGKNTVASPQVVNGSLQTVDLSKKARKALKGNRGLRGLPGANGAQGAQGAKGATGAQGPAGPGARWFLLSGDHTAILAQSGGISIAAGSGSNGVYFDMGADVNGKVIQATPAYTDADGNVRGSVIATICGGSSQYHATCTASGTDDTRHVWVFTESTAGASEKHAVYVAVF